MRSSRSRTPAIRRGLLKRIAGRLAARYRDEVAGETLGERMKSLVGLMGEREIPFSVDESMSLPVISAQACPYPELAKADRGVCTMEKLMFSEILGCERATIGVPVGWRHVLHLHTERVISDDRGLRFATGVNK